MTIKTIESLLRETWRYEPDILKLILKFLFVPVYEDEYKEYRYIEVFPKPETTWIDDNRFKDCNNLQSVIINELVEDIGFNAFTNCASHNSVLIPN